jgi:hypothetical protein
MTLNEQRLQPLDFSVVDRLLCALLGRGPFALPAAGEQIFRAELGDGLREVKTMRAADLSIWHWTLIAWPFLVAAILLGAGISRLQRKEIASGSVHLFLFGIATIAGLLIAWNLFGR